MALRPADKSCSKAASLAPKGLLLSLLSTLLGLLPPQRPGPHGLLALHSSPMGDLEVLELCPASTSPPLPSSRVTLSDEVRQPAPLQMVLALGRGKKGGRAGQGRGPRQGMSKRRVGSHWTGII